MAAAALTPPLADLFVTNLRLLDLDKRPDWPDIDPKTFSSKDVLGQNQKARIRCCEWALYRLFEIWDPEDTKDVRFTRHFATTFMLTRCCRSYSHSSLRSSPFNP